MISIVLFGAADLSQALVAEEESSSTEVFGTESNACGGCGGNEPKPDRGSFSLHGDSIIACELHDNRRDGARSPRRLSVSRESLALVQPEPLAQRRNRYFFV
ncbi:MAG: hypothetical protein M0038_11585 [Pseudomonadota bacterium]|nr:hypothetical protein [Pseudomonadota bacterium]